MNNSSDSHEPTPEFRAQLKRDISRAVRSDQRFGSLAAPVESRRFTMAFGIAAGVVLTLATGMVLGASVSYASAEVVDSPRPALAILPIGDAINALRCAPAPATPAKQVAQAVSPVQAAQQDVPVVDSSVLTSATAPRSSPDRARIAALATEHQSAIVRGDTAAEYIVMVLDAAEQYVWSTIGSGNLSIEVGGDSRTPLERTEYNRQYQAEFWGSAGVGGRGGLPLRVLHDSLGGDFFSGAKAAAGGGARGTGVGRGARGGGAGIDSLAGLDSLAKRLRVADGARGVGDGRLVKAKPAHFDSLPERLHVRGAAADSLYAAFGRRAAEPGSSARGGRGGGGSNTGTPSAGSGLPGPYRNGWSGTRNGPLFNQASGLQEPAPGQSGIEGLVATSVASADIYRFPAGELAPNLLQIMVVRLTPGTVWRGR